MQPGWKLVNFNLSNHFVLVMGGSQQQETLTQKQSQQWVQGEDPDVEKNIVLTETKVPRNNFE